MNFFPTYVSRFTSTITCINSIYRKLVWPSIWPKSMDFGHAGFRSFWEIIGFYWPQAVTHRNPLGTDAIQSGLARNRRNALRLYCRLGLCHMVPQHAQLCCTSPCVAGREINFVITYRSCMRFGGVCLRPLAQLFPIRRNRWMLIQVSAYLMFSLSAAGPVRCKFMIYLMSWVLNVICGWLLLVFFRNVWIQSIIGICNDQEILQRRRQCVWYVDHNFLCESIDSIHQDSSIRSGTRYILD